jgi:hypothetical protein
MALEGEWEGGDPGPSCNLVLDTGILWLVDSGPHPPPHRNQTLGKIGLAVSRGQSASDKWQVSR